MSSFTSLKFPFILPRYIFLYSFNIFSYFLLQYIFLSSPPKYFLIFTSIISSYTPPINASRLFLKLLQQSSKTPPIYLLKLFQFIFLYSSNRFAYYLLQYIFLCSYKINSYTPPIYLLIFSKISSFFQYISDLLLQYIFLYSSNIFS